jgi:hypothetical protein
MFGSLITFVRDSPKRLRWFERLQKKEANALRPYCPTRWVLRESALTSVLLNYTELWTFMEDVSTTDKSEVGAKASSFASQMSTFHIYFGLTALNKLFTAVGTVNQALQASDLHFQQANRLIQNLKELLQSLRDQFTEFWTSTTDAAEGLGVDEPVLPRIRRVPRRLDDQDEGSHGHVFPTPEKYYQQQFLSLIDAAAVAIADRFHSDTWTFLSDAESALITRDTAVISNFYGTDLDADRLKLHVEMFHDLANQKNIHVNTFGDVVSILKGRCHNAHSSS